MRVNISDIIIDHRMKATPPSFGRVHNKVRYVAETGEFPYKIAINNDMVLVDGYASYLAAMELGIKAVKCDIMEREIENNASSHPNRRVYIQPVTKKDIYDRSGGICSICGKPLSKNNYTVEHWIPLARGGTNNTDNLRVAHKRCNTCKDSMTINEYCESLLDVVQFQARQNNQIAKIMIRSSVRLVMQLTARKVKSFLL